MSDSQTFICTLCGEEKPNTKQAMAAYYAEVGTVLACKACHPPMNLEQSLEYWERTRQMKNANAKP